MQSTRPRLSDADLLAATRRLAGRCRQADAELILHLAEVDARKLFASEGYPSMFRWCMAELALSEDEVFKRITVARAAVRFPDLIDRLATGTIHLTGLSMLAPRLTEANCRDLLDAATGRSKREIEQLMAQRFPRPDAPTSIRAVQRRPSDRRATTAPATDAGRQQGKGEVGPAAGPSVVPPCEPLSVPLFAPAREPAANAQEPWPDAVAGAWPCASSPPSPRPGSAADAISPLGGVRYKVQFTADQALVDKLRDAQALLSHRLPDGDLAQVFDQALSVLCERLRKERFAAGPGRKASQPVVPEEHGHVSDAATGSRHIPAHVKRQVVERDGERCTFIASDGRRCEGTRFLEFHHLVPWAKGGHHDVDNITLRCRTHNDHAARLDYGSAFIDARRQGRTPPGGRATIRAGP
jgi:hypothetical protein